MIEEAEDTDKIIQNVDRMAQRGVRFKQSEVRARLGFSEPDDDDEVIGVNTPPATAKTATALNRPNDPSSITDSLEDDLNADWEDVMSAVLGPVIELLETATDYDDAIALVSEAFPKMNNPALINALVKSAVKARAEGDRPNSDAADDG